MGHCREKLIQYQYIFFRMLKLVVLSCLLGLSLSAPKSKNELTCTICTDVLTDLSEWVTSETTEQEIITFLEDSLCAALGALIPDLGTSCNELIEAQLPAIIEGIVNDNFNPTQICADILACP